MALKTQDELLKQFQTSGPLSTEQITGAPNVSDFNTVNSSNINPNPAFPTVTVPPTPQPTNFTPQIDANLQSLTDGFNQATKANENETNFQSQILQSIQKLGSETGRTQELSQQAGLPQQQKELQDVINQLTSLSREAQAIPLQEEQKAQQRGIVTKAGQAPITASALRENAIKALGLSAIGATLQGNIALAQQNIQNAIKAEFEPERTKLQLLQQAYLFNRDILQREDAKRTKQLEFTLQERSRLLANQEAERKEIYNIGTIAQQNGAPANIVQDVFNATSREDALKAVGQYAQDPKAKVELQNALLDTELTKIKIAQEQAQLDVYRKYGGLTPTQYLEQIKKEEADRKKSLEEIDEAKENGIILNNSVTQIDSILNSSALDSIVGSNIFSRGIGRQKGFISSGISAITSLGLSGTLAEISGKADDTVALTQQIIDQQFLDKLIEVKAKGAVFGALSDREGQALRNAANAISNTAIKKDDRIIGYDMSEKEFKKQMGFIQATMKRAYEKATGEAFSNDEQEVFDAIDEANQAVNFNPAF